MNTSSAAVHRDRGADARGCIKSPSACVPKQFGMQFEVLVGADQSGLRPQQLNKDQSSQRRSTRQLTDASRWIARRLSGPVSVEARQTPVRDQGSGVRDK